MRSGCFHGCTFIIVALCLSRARVSRLSSYAMHRGWSGRQNGCGWEWRPLERVHCTRRHHGTSHIYIFFVIIIIITNIHYMNFLTIAYGLYDHNYHYIGKFYYIFCKNKHALYTVVSYNDS